MLVVHQVWVLPDKYKYAGNLSFLFLCNSTWILCQVPNLLSGWNSTPAARSFFSSSHYLGLCPSYGYLSVKASGWVIYVEYHISMLTGQDVISGSPLSVRAGSYWVELHSLLQSPFGVWLLLTVAYEGIIYHSYTWEIFYCSCHILGLVHLCEAVFA